MAEPTPLIPNLYFKNTPSHSLEQRPGSQLSEAVAAEGPHICGPMEVDADVYLLAETPGATFLTPSNNIHLEQIQSQLLQAGIPSSFHVDAYAQFQMAREGFSPLMRGVRNFFIASADYHNRMHYFVQHPKSSDFQGLRGAPFRADNPIGRVMRVVSPRAFSYAAQPELHHEAFTQAQQFYDRWGFRLGTFEKGIRLLIDSSSVAQVFDGELDVRSAGGLALAGMDSAQVVQSVRGHFYYVKGNSLRSSSPETSADFFMRSQRFYMKMNIIQAASGAVRLVIELMEDHVRPTSVAFAVLDLTQGVASTAYSIQLLNGAAQASGATEASRVLLNVSRAGDKMKIGLGMIGMAASALNLGLSIYIYCEAENDPNLDPKMKERIQDNSLFGIVGSSAMIVSGVFTCLRLFSWATAFSGVGLVILAGGFLYDYLAYHDEQ